jgi:hypothetical protein
MRAESMSYLHYRKLGVLRGEARTTVVGTKLVGIELIDVGRAPLLGYLLSLLCSLARRTNQNDPARPQFSKLELSPQKSSWWPTSEFDDTSGISSVAVQNRSTVREFGTGASCQDRLKRIVRTEQSGTQPG